MWLLLLTLLVSNAWTAPVNDTAGNSTSNGPVSSEEGRILWKDGHQAFQEGRYQDAVNSLQRLVDRYPGYPGYLEAHRDLGRSLMLLGKSEEAVKPLKSYINATGERPEGLQARLWLGEDYLELAKPSEAYLDALGIEKATQGTNPHLYAESQFLKTRALIGLNQDRRAQRVIDSIELNPVVQSDPILSGHLARAKIELKLRSCARFPNTETPGGKVMDEGQAREQFQKRALCLQESLSLFKSIIESDHESDREMDTESVSDSTKRIYDGYVSYAQAVLHPPEPPKLKPVDRTPEQKRQYKAELIDRLEKDRAKAVEDCLSTLSAWKSKAMATASASKAGMTAATAYADLSGKIRKAEK